MHALPFLVCQVGVVEDEIVLPHTVEKADIGTGQIGAALVDLIERIGADHQRHTAAMPVDDRLNERKKRFARAIDRQHFGIRIDAVQCVTPLHPVRDGLAQGALPERAGIARKPAQSGDQRFLDEDGRSVLRFSDIQPNGLEFGVGCGAGHQLAQFLERIRLQLAKVGIHGRCWLSG